MEILPGNISKTPEEWNFMDILAGNIYKTPEGCHFMDILPGNISKIPVGRHLGIYNLEILVRLWRYYLEILARLQKDEIYGYITWKILARLQKDGILWIYYLENISKSPKGWLFMDILPGKY